MIIDFKLEVGQARQVRQGVSGQRLIEMQRHQTRWQHVLTYGSVFEIGPKPHVLEMHQVRWQHARTQGLVEKQLSKLEVDQVRQVRHQSLGQRLVEPFSKLEVGQARW